jgi:hypothetical protein
MNRRHIWQRQIVPMLDWIKYRCGPHLQSAAPWWDDGAHALPLTYDELAAHSDGLDFTTDGKTSVRGLLYTRRQDIQAQFGLYFDDYPGGLRFTLLPKLGMLWRYEEEQRRTQNALARTAEMTREALHAVGTRQVEAALFRAVDKQYQEIGERAGRLRQITQELFARPQAPKALPPPRRRRKRIQPEQ